MKRFWLLLLAFILPLQMSWAAVHFCNDTAAVVVAVQSAEPVEVIHAHEKAKENTANAGGVDTLAEACCGAAHGCHGLHSLISQSDRASVSASAGNVLISSDPAIVGDPFSMRHERPKWLAA